MMRKIKYHNFDILILTESYLEFEKPIEFEWNIIPGLNVIGDPPEDPGRFARLEH